MAGLIRNLMLLVQVTRRAMHEEVVNLGELAHATAVKLQKRDPKRRVIISIDPGLSAQGDKHLLGIMLTKLMETAWKFTRNRPITEISVGKQNKDGHTIFYIRDNGGKKRDTLAQTIAGRVVQRHRGQFWAEREENRGATFYFTLQDHTEL